MKNLVSTMTMASFLFSIFVVASGAQEKAKRGRVPTITVLLENDRVKVYEGHFRSGDKSAQMSKRPARVEIAVTDGQMRNYYQDGKVEDVTWKAGEVKWSEPATYQQENMGKSEFRTNVVQIK